MQARPGVVSPWTASRNEAGILPRALVVTLKGPFAQPFRIFCGICEHTKSSRLRIVAVCEGILWLLAIEWRMWTAANVPIVMLSNRRRVGTMISLLYNLVISRLYSYFEYQIRSILCATYDFIQEIYLLKWCHQKFVLPFSQCSLIHWNCVYQTTLFSSYTFTNLCKRNHGVARDIPQK